MDEDRTQDEGEVEGHVKRFHAQEEVPAEPSEREHEPRDDDEDDVEAHGLRYPPTIS